jgi:hypothetical protein
LRTKAYKSKTKINFTDFDQHFTFILSVLFCGEIGTRNALCVRYTFCAGGPYLGAKSGLANDFLLNFFFPTTHLEMGM